MVNMSLIILELKLELCLTKESSQFQVFGISDELMLKHCL